MSESKPLSLKDLGEFIDAFKSGEEPCQPDYQLTADQISALAACMDCSTCNGELWVCEEHPDHPWQDGDGCCGAPGIPCKCNHKELMPPGTEILWDIERGYLQ